MNFLLVNYEYPPIGGGAATATSAIAHALHAAGHRVMVLTASFGDLPCVTSEDGVAVRRVRCRRARADRSTVGEMLSFLLAALAALPRITREQRFDGAIAFFSFPTGPIGLAAKFLKRVPYVVSLRGGDVPGAEPGLALMHTMLRPLRRLVLRNAVAVVANSEGLRQMSLAADPVPVRVIPNGVDAQFFQPSPESWRSAAECFRILFVGRFQAQKNVTFLLDQLAQLRADTSDRFAIELVGDGPLRTPLQEHASSLGLEGHTTWRGWLPREQLRAVYQSCHCFVNPSFYEGMPNAVLEAMACGKPVIASRVAGNDAVVRDGVTGFLFDLQDAASFRDAICSLMHTPQRAEQMGRAARDWVERDFSWARVADGYAALFR